MGCLKQEMRRNSPATREMCDDVVATRTGYGVDFALVATAAVRSIVAVLLLVLVFCSLLLHCVCGFCVLVLVLLYSFLWSL